MEEHDIRVLRVARDIRQFHQTATSFRIYHGNTNSTRPSSRTHLNTLDISGLNHIVAIDSVRKICLVEPNVPMDKLVEATLTYKLVPPVIPEFPGITVGGAFAGTAGESTSFRYGFFEDCVNSAEIVLANGDVVHASQIEYADLFQGSKGTFGTLGVGTLFEVRLIDAKKYVQVQYAVVSQGINEAKAIMEEAGSKSSQDVQFLDGIMFSKDKGVIVIGRMTDESAIAEKESKGNSLPITRFSRASDPWFYLHAQEVAKSYSNAASSAFQELIPLKDYLFRYDRGAFWTGRLAFNYFITPFNWITRWALDYFMHTRTMYHALHRSGLMQKFVVQDMAVPWENIRPFFDWLDEDLNIYPLWLAPLKVGEGGIHFNPKFADRTANEGTDVNMVLNVGVWGYCPNNTLKINRDIEAKLMELKGNKWLYSQTFYTPNEFWSIYDERWYKDLRKKYEAETLPDVYEKVGGTALNQRNVLTGIWAFWPFAGVYGVLSSLKGGDYLRKK